MTWDYIAGFFDGEGCISIYDYEHKRTFKDRPKGPYIMKEKYVKISLDQKIRIFVHMVQKQTEVLEEIQEFLVAEGIQANFHIKKTGMGAVQFSSRESVRVFLNKVIPYLRVKNHKAQIALDFLNGVEQEVLS